MKYHITHSDSELYLPKIEHWILEDLNLKLNEAMLYKMILIKGYLTWGSEYIGKILKVSGKSVRRMVDSLCERELIEKRIKVFGSRKHWVLVCLYTSNGERTSCEINDLFNKGFIKLQSDLNNRKGYEKR